MQRESHNILIKYCGGCNPSYDRVSVVEKLNLEFPNLQFLYANDGITTTDFLLVVCGCQSKCASRDGLYGYHDPLTIASSNEYERVRKEIARLIAGP
jgi:hypothetical protein